MVLVTNEFRRHELVESGDLEDVDQTKRHSVLRASFHTHPAPQLGRPIFSISLGYRGCTRMGSKVGSTCK